DADPPLLGWVFSDDWADKNPALAKGLIDASYEAKALLKTDDAVWEQLRPIMDAEDDAIFQAQKDVLAAESAFEVMRAADPASVANLERLPDGTFWAGYLK